MTIKLRWPWQWGATDPQKIREEAETSERKLREARLLDLRTRRIEVLREHRKA